MISALLLGILLCVGGVILISAARSAAKITYARVMGYIWLVAGAILLAVGLVGS